MSAELGEDNIISQGEVKLNNQVKPAGRLMNDYKVCNTMNQVNSKVQYLTKKYHANYLVEPIFFGATSSFTYFNLEFFPFK